MVGMDSLDYRVFAAAKEGKPISIYSMLCSKKPEEVASILSAHTEENGQITTPLIIAARNGHDAVVKLLLTDFRTDIEQTGTVKFDGVTVQGATALFCAAAEGHIQTVKELLAFNPCVNHATAKNSTPLRAACRGGHLDIVAMLVEHHADITLCDKSYKQTYLMLAAYRGHADVVRYLLEQGAKPNDVDYRGATALHYSAVQDTMLVTRDLINAGASMLKNQEGMTPLLMAAEAGSAEIVKFFVSQPSCSRRDRIEALELLGTSYLLNDNGLIYFDRMDACYNCMWLAMQERYNDKSGNVLEKVVDPPVEAYENRVECRTIEELPAIKDDRDALHIEALLVRERVLGENNVKLPRHIVHCGALFGDAGRFDRCAALWTRALQLKQKNNRSANQDLLLFVQMFSRMFHLGKAVEFSLPENVFEHCLVELEKDQLRVKTAQNNVDLKTAQDGFANNIRSALYILAILTKVHYDNDEEFRLCRLVYRLNQLHVTLPSNAQTLLHTVCDASTHVDDYDGNDVVQFPSEPLAKLLLRCGADPNQTDAVGNTPLHVIVKYNTPASESPALQNIITMLLDAGVHVDRANASGVTSSEVASTSAQTILRTKRPMSLKCLAARVIRQHKVAYKDEVPQALYEFIEMH